MIIVDYNIVRRKQFHLKYFRCKMQNEELGYKLYIYCDTCQKCE